MTIHGEFRAVLGAGLLAAAVAPARAQVPGLRPFSADQITTHRAERQQGKVYATEHAMRIEAQQEGQPSIVILRFDRKVLWTMLPGQRMYMEVPMGGGRSFTEAAQDPTAKIEREPLGTERVGAYTCSKYRVRVTSQGGTFSGIQWAANELDGLIVKMTDEQTGSTVEYQNIRLGAPDPSLFEVPAGYQKMTMPGAKP